VKYAGIYVDKDHCAGHNGVGAVMGVKKLKAFCAPLVRTSILNTACCDEIALT
jgi:hypothetical protein